MNIQNLLSLFILIWAKNLLFIIYKFQKQIENIKINFKIIVIKVDYFFNLLNAITIFFPSLYY